MRPRIRPPRRPIWKHLSKQTALLFILCWGVVMMLTFHVLQLPYSNVAVTIAATSTTSSSSNSPVNSVSLVVVCPADSKPIDSTTTSNNIAFNVITWLQTSMVGEIVLVDTSETNEILDEVQLIMQRWYLTKAEDASVRLVHVAFDMITARNDPYSWANYRSRAWNVGVAYATLPNVLFMDCATHMSDVTPRTVKLDTLSNHPYNVVTFLMDRAILLRRTSVLDLQGFDERVPDLATGYVLANRATDKGGSIADAHPMDLTDRGTFERLIQIYSKQYLETAIKDVIVSSRMVRGMNDLLLVRALCVKAAIVLSPMTPIPTIAAGVNKPVQHKPNTPYLFHVRHHGARNGSHVISPIRFLLKTIQQELLSPPFSLPGFLVQDCTSAGFHKLLRLYLDAMTSPTHTVLVAHVLHGLGNRIRTMSSAIHFSLATGRVPLIIWERDEHCGARFEELFQGDSTAYVIDQWSGGQWPNLGTWHHKNFDLFNYLDTEIDSGRLAGLTFGAGDTTYIPTQPTQRHVYVRTSKMIVFEHGVDLPSFEQTKIKSDIVRSISPNHWIRDTLRPVHDVQVKVEQYLRRIVLTGYPKPTIGIHMRTLSLDQDIKGVKFATAYSAETVQRMKMFRDVASNVTNFVQVMMRHWEQDPTQTFFVAADDADAIDRLVRELPSDKERALVQYQVGVCSSREVACLQTALVDMLVLAHTKFLYGSGWSSYSEAVCRFSKVLGFHVLIVKGELLNEQYGLPSYCV